MGKKRYPPRIPRAANGFRAQDLRALPRGAWWVKRWLQAIEAMRLGARAGRGRVYAEQGQVTALTVSGGHVEATVLGGRPDPYTVKIDFAPLPPGGEGLGAMALGRILDGEMPSVVEEMFALRGLSPYPTLGVDRFWCSCPDWSKPCKHIAAVLYLLGDVLVRQPALLLRLRGVPPPGDSAEAALPLWKGTVKFADALGKIYRRTGVA
jgi:uncharacterized Zn finger protein